ncbi:uridylate-specific endoribonuclease-like [Saccostrea echinata]|uniref:uridylate-specific endoribonuclease-like n=1 Tax=Saccostrea echinata TaxID=191078 RepID=UPI002A8179F5|nr:uridylate-specific endoribonuclease-like [Saccostrea echinata]
MWRVLVLVILTPCVLADTCSGRCGAGHDPSKTCQCNTHCVTYGDCCADYHTLCTQQTCTGRCNAALDNSKPCQCNSACVNFGDCCPDYQTLCVDGGTPDITCDISCLANQLWDNDVNRVQVWEYEVNHQGQTTTSSTSDEAAQKLFTYLQEETVFQKPTYRTFIALLDNYTPSTSQTESQGSAEWVEIDAFLDAILATDIMNHLYNFLVEHGHVTDAASYREVLKELWFNLYARSSSGPINSSGFEHVMVGETSSKVSGFHNWIQFYLEEKNSAINYQGWVSRKQPLNIVAARFTWNGLSKAKGSFFVGVSPEFDIAIYTACALTRPNAICSFAMAGNSLQIQTYDVAHKTGLQVATAYPNI